MGMAPSSKIKTQECKWDAVNKNLPTCAYIVERMLNYYDNESLGKTEKLIIHNHLFHKSTISLIRVYIFCTTQTLQNVYNKINQGPRHCTSLLLNCELQNKQPNINPLSPFCNVINPSNLPSNSRSACI